MNIKKYIERIDFKDKVEVSVACLKKLHRHHVMSIPFEALDIHFDNRIHLDLDKIFNKIIERNRGGYCYELNLLFHTLLTEIGFENYLISASIFDNDQFGPAFDHMAIIVKLEEDWLVDVGFGDLFLEPILKRNGYVQDDRFKIKSSRAYFPIMTIRLSIFPSPNILT